jgi:uncharacterized membrane protein
MTAAGSFAERPVTTAAAVRPRRRALATARTLVFAVSALYALVFVAAAILHFLAYRSAHLDLGTMTQTVWSTAHGHLLEMTNANGRNVMRFAYHVDPMLALLVPLWWIWPSGVMLVTVQAVAVAGGAIPVYWLARKHLRTERSAVHFAFAYLLFPATQFNAFTISSGFHSVALAVPLILFAIWYLDENRLVPFTIFALLAVTTKEEIGAAVGCLGVWYAVRHGERVVGAAIFVAGTAISLFNFLYVIPHYTANGSNPFEDRYSQLGKTPTGIVHSIFTNPSAVIHDVATWHKLFYVVLLLGPFLGFFLREPLLFLGAVPDLAINLLSNHADQTNIAYHWTAGVIPFTIAAAVLGADRLRRHADRTSLWVLAAVLSIAIFSPIYLGRGDLRDVLSPTPTQRAKEAALKLIPAGVPVTASNELGAYLAGRRYSYTLPVVGDARWAVIDRADDTYADAAGYGRLIKALEASPRWRAVFKSHGVEVLHRVGRPGT